jgi:ferredoxin-NADP reductase
MAFMAAVQTDLERRGVSLDRIHSESFGPVG